LNNSICTILLSATSPTE